MNGVMPDDRAKLPRKPRQRWMHRVVALIVLISLSLVAVLYQTTRSSSGIQVRWHLGQLHFGPYYLRQIVFDTNECYTATARGYRLGLCDVFRVTRGPGSPGGSLVINSNFWSAGSIVVGQVTGPEIWRAVAEGLERPRQVELDAGPEHDEVSARTNGMLPSPYQNLR